MSRAPRGLTLVDVCIVLVMCAILFGVVVPTFIGRSREQGNRVKCASNLRQIGQGIQMYANENKGNFPRALYDGVGGTPTEYTAPLFGNPFLPGGPGPNDVTAALFLLLRTQDLTSEVFVCPSSQCDRWDYAGRQVTGVSNFPSRQYLSYSYVNPYPTPEVVAKGFKLNYTLTSDFAIAADMNPGAPAVVTAAPNWSKKQMATANSRNHNGDGQNVLYADGHVEFQNTPFCGMQRFPARRAGPTGFRDNVYTYGDGFGNAAGVGVKGPSVDAEDSVLLPSLPDGPAVPDAPRTTLWIFVAIAAAVMLGVVLMIVALVRGTGQQQTAPPPLP